MLLRAEIRFRRSTYDDGFGFTCLKAAYHFGIRGRMEYSNNSGVTIHAEGETPDVRQFLHWFEGIAFELKELHYSHSPAEGNRYQEFDLLRLAD